MPRFQGIPIGGGRFGGLPVETAEEQDMFSGSEPQSALVPGKTVAELQEPSSLGRTVHESIRERTGKVGEFAEGKGVFESGSVAVVGLGQAAGAALDIGGAIAVEAIKSITPEPVKEMAKGVTEDILNTDVGKKGVEAMQKGVAAYSEFSEKYPDAAVALEGIFNITGVAIGRKAGQVVGKEIKEIAGDVARKAVPPSAEGIDRSIRSVVKKGISKGIRPKRTKGSFSQAEKGFDRAATGVQEIVTNKQNLSFVDDIGDTVQGAVPENLSQFAQSIEQTKRKIFSQFDELAQSTGDFVPIDDAVAAIGQRLSKKAIQAIPGADSRKYAEEFMERLRKAGPLSAKEAQEIITELNGRLTTYHANPSVAAKGIAAVDNEVVLAMRKALDKTISTATGSRYQALKNNYGALRSLEDDVGKALHRDMVKAKASFGDLITDVGSGTQMAYAVATQNAALAAASVTSKVIGKLHKITNDSNKTIKTMFQNVEKLVEKKKLGSAPKSVTGRAIEKRLTRGSP